MSGRLNRGAFEQLIKENLEWLAKQPPTLEREHIRMIVEQSPTAMYGADAAEMASLRAQVETFNVLIEAHDKDAGKFVRGCILKGFVPSSGMDKLRAELRAANSERDAVYEAFAKAERELEVLRAKVQVLRTVVEASDAFDRAVHVHLNVSEDADMPGLDAAVTNYKAAIEKARGLL